MSRLLIEPVTPDEPGYIALKAESIALNFNMLRRLEENWQRGENRFNAPGEKLLGAFLNGKLVGVCGLNRDPFSQQRAPDVFAISTSARSAAGWALANSF
jgi:hypothetical protein